MVSPSDIVANVLDRDIIISDFQHYSSYKFHFQADTLWKGMNSLIPPAMGLNSITAVSARLARVLNNQRSLICD